MQFQNLEPEFIRLHLTLRKIEGPSSIHGASCKTVAQGWFTCFHLKERFEKQNENKERKKETEVKRPLTMRSAQSFPVVA